MLETRNQLPCNTVDRIRVLVVFTQNAVNAVGGQNVILNRINNAIAGFNQAHAVSGVTSNFAQMELAGFEQTNYVEFRRGLAITEQAHLDGLFQNLSNATSVRKAQTNADIVYCACDHNHTNTLGVANAIGPVNDLNSYAVGDIDAMPAQPIFQHEIGHLIGGRHFDDPAPGDAHGDFYNFKPCWFCSRVFRATLMVPGAEPNVQRPNRWSNPNITDNGAATGTIATNNVARNINQNAQTISQIRPNQTLFSYISGETSIYTSGTYDYTINYGCSSSHTFQWFSSSDGIIFFPIASGTTSISRYFYPGHASPYYLRSIVTGGDGQQSISTIGIYLDFTIFPRPVTNDISANLLTISPNPSNDHLYFEYSFSNESSNVAEIEVMSLDGMKILSFNREILNGKLSHNIDISNLHNGMYTLILKTGDKTIQKKFVKM